MKIRGGLVLNAEELSVFIEDIAIIVEREKEWLRFNIMLQISCSGDCVSKTPLKSPVSAFL